MRACNLPPDGTHESVILFCLGTVHVEHLLAEVEICGCSVVDALDLEQVGVSRLRAKCTLVSHDHSLAVQPSGLLPLASTLGLEVLAGLLKELADVNSGGLAEVRLHIGGGPTPDSYAVPNGYCYANACFEDFVAVGTAATFNGATKLSTLQSSPDMSTNPSATSGNSCGRANAACMAPPATWNGGEAVFKICTKTAGDETSCSLAEKQGQAGMLPSV